MRTKTFTFKMYPEMPDWCEMLRYRCQNCGNGCLVSPDIIGDVCACGQPDWHPLRFQESYIQGRSDWIYEFGTDPHVHPVSNFAEAGMGTETE